MNWTKELPTKPGYYWHRYTAKKWTYTGDKHEMEETRELEIILAWDYKGYLARNGFLEISRMGTDDATWGDIKDSEYLGPLEEPK